MLNSASFDKKIKINKRNNSFCSSITVTCFFTSSSHFQINKEGPVGIWSGAIECTTAPICRVNSWQLACVCKWVCVHQSSCVHCMWAVTPSGILCTIECDTTWWWRELGAFKWHVVMTAPTFHSNLGYSFCSCHLAQFSWTHFHLFLPCLRIYLQRQWKTKAKNKSPKIKTSGRTKEMSSSDWWHISLWL